MSAETQKAAGNSGSGVAPEPPAGRVGWLFGIRPAAAEGCFQDDQEQTVVWVQSLEWCPPMLALLRGKMHAKFLDPWAVAFFVTTLLAMATCNATLHLGWLDDRELEEIGLAEASIMSGWLLVFASSILLDAIPFRWLLRLVSLLVGGTVLIHHESAAVMVSPVAVAVALYSCHPVPHTSSLCGPCTTRL